MALVSGAAATGLLTACGGEPPRQAARTATRADGMPRAASSVVALKAQYADHHHTHATATIVDSSRGWLVTSNHSVEGAKALTLTLPDATQVAARVLARAPCDDVALLGLVARPPGLVALKPAASDHVKVGERVMALGFPADVTDARRAGSPKLALASGAVAMTAADVPLTPLLPALHGLLGHHAPVSPGLSGGPLLSSDGRMIGLTVTVGAHDGPAPAINMSFATRGTRIAELLRQLTLTGDGSGGYSGWQDQHRCHDGMATLAHAVSEPDHQHPGASARRGMTGEEHHHD
ncbi:MAG TPA: serine protease [Baekduia sp.]|nr:serine protease [Baekduia sp.]